MSDPSSLLQIAIRNALKANVNVLGAFDGAAVKIYDIPPVNAVEPYIVARVDVVEPLVAEGYDGAIATATVDIWSLTDPPGTAQAQAIAQVTRACLVTIGDLAGFSIDPDLASGETRYLIDQDGKTVHAICQLKYTASPR